MPLVCSLFCQVGAFTRRRDEIDGLSTKLGGQSAGGQVIILFVFGFYLFFATRFRKGNKTEVILATGQKYRVPKNPRFGKRKNKQKTTAILPAPSKRCLLVVFKYLKACKRHPLEGAGASYYGLLKLKRRGQRPFHRGHASEDHGQCGALGERSGRFEWGEVGKWKGGHPLLGVLFGGF